MKTQCVCLFLHLCVCSQRTMESPSQSSRYLNRFAIPTFQKTIYSKTNLPYSIKLYIDTSINREIKDKNRKNEISSYRIILSTNVKAILQNNEQEINFAVLKIGDYYVGARNTLTLDNQKRVEKTLVNQMTNDILNGLISRINDL